MKAANLVAVREPLFYTASAPKQGNPWRWFKSFY